MCNELEIFRKKELQQFLEGKHESDCTVSTTMYITENNNSNVNDDNNNTHKISIHVGLSGVQFSL